jgi:hypothetical protein
MEPEASTTDETRFPADKFQVDGTEEVSGFFEKGLSLAFPFYLLPAAGEKS